MTPMWWALLFLSGGLGAATRWAVGELFFFFWKKSFPLHVLVINISGSFFLGLGAGYLFSRFSDELVLVLGTGFLGAYTTMSAASVDAVKLLNMRKAKGLAQAFVYIFGTLIGAVVMGWIGFLVGLQFF